MANEIKTAQMLYVTNIYNIRPEQLIEHLEEIAHSPQSTLISKGDATHWLGHLYEELKQQFKAVVNYKKSLNFYLQERKKNNSVCAKTLGACNIEAVQHLVSHVNIFSCRIKNNYNKINNSCFINQEQQLTKDNHLLTSIKLTTNSSNQSFPCSDKHIVEEINAIINDEHQLETELVLKTVYKRDLSTLDNEYLLMKKLCHHENFVIPLARFRNTCSESILMEYGGKTLNQYSRKQENFLEIFRQTIQAVDYMHGQGIIHGDLKASNLLIKEDKEGSFLVKIIDFGSAKYKSQLFNNPSTPLYSSLELYKTTPTKATSAIDIWSLGVLFYELKYNAQPFSQMKRFPTLRFIQSPHSFYKHRLLTMFFNKKKGVASAFQQDYIEHLPLINQKCPIDVLLYQMLNPVAEKRPSLDYIKLTLNEEMRKHELSKYRYEFQALC